VLLFRNGVSSIRTAKYNLKGWSSVNRTGSERNSVQIPGNVCPDVSTEYAPGEYAQREYELPLYQVVEDRRPIAR